MHQRRVIPLVTALVLSACASNSSSTNSPTTSPPQVGGMTECTTAAIQPFVTAYVELSSANNQMPIDDLQCANGWAVASGILGPKNPPAGGPEGAPTSLVAEAEGQFWIIKEKSKVCGTFNPDEPEAVPADAEIPVALYVPGCLAG